MFIMWLQPSYLSFLHTGNLWHNPVAQVSPGYSSLSFAGGSESVPVPPGGKDDGGSLFPAGVRISHSSSRVMRSQSSSHFARMDHYDAESRANENSSLPGYCPVRPREVAHLTSMCEMKMKSLTVYVY